MLRKVRNYFRWLKKRKRAWDMATEQLTIGYKMCSIRTTTQNEELRKSAREWELRYQRYYRMLMNYYYRKNIYSKTRPSYLI